jgi:hypothetical protein
MNPFSSEASEAMRLSYRGLTDDNVDAILATKRAGAEFWAALDNAGSSRELSLAKTRLEEAVMWATKHFTSGAANTGGTEAHP